MLASGAHALTDCGGLWWFAAAVLEPLDEVVPSSMVHERRIAHDPVLAAYCEAVRSTCSLVRSLVMKVNLPKMHEYAVCPSCIRDALISAEYTTVLI